VVDLIVTVVLIVDDLGTFFSLSSCPTRLDVHVHVVLGILVPVSVGSETGLR
jgi:hypothetical protein